jgi:hypothetical protein
VASVLERSTGYYVSFIIHPIIQYQYFTALTMPETEPTTQASYAASLFSPRIMDPNSLEHLRLYLEDDQGPRELGGPADPADQHDTLPNSQFFLPGYKNVFGTLKLNGISHVGGHVESAAFHPNPQSSPTKDDNEEYCKREGTLTVCTVGIPRQH